MYVLQKAVRVVLRIYPLEHSGGILSAIFWTSIRRELLHVFDSITTLARGAVKQATKRQVSAPLEGDKSKFGLPLACLYLCK